jgi:hypothetical protein
MISEGPRRRDAIDATRLTSIRDALWPHRRADTIPGDREIRGSTVRSGSHASTGNPLPDPQIASIGLQGPSERPFRGNRAVLDWGTKPPRPVGIGVALDSIAVPVIRPSCSPVRHYGICLAWRFPGLCTVISANSETRRRVAEPDSRDVAKLLLAAHSPLHPDLRNRVSMPVYGSDAKSERSSETRALNIVERVDEGSHAPSPTQRKNILILASRSLHAIALVSVGRGNSENAIKGT